jgi:hypothetical protein
MLSFMRLAELQAGTRKPSRRGFSRPDESQRYGGTQDRNFAKTVRLLEHAPSRAKKGARELAASPGVKTFLFELRVETLGL